MNQITSVVFFPFPHLIIYERAIHVDLEGGVSASPRADSVGSVLAMSLAAREVRRSLGFGAFFFWSPLFVWITMLGSQLNMSFWACVCVCVKQGFQSSRLVMKRWWKCVGGS